MILRDGRTTVAAHASGVLTDDVTEVATAEGVHIEFE